MDTAGGIDRWRLSGMKKMIAVLVLIAGSGMAQAAEWWPVQGTNDEVWFLDQSSLTSVAGTRVGWVRIETKASSVVAGKAKRALKKIAAHCKSGTLQVMSWIDYAANGNVLGSSVTPTNAFEFYPESVGETLYQFMCGLKKNWPTQKPIVDPAGFTEIYFSTPEQGGS